MLIRDGYDRRKRNPRMLHCRVMTLAEAKVLRAGSHILFRALDGSARTVKVNGAPVTWKTRPEDCDIPVKYGMYEFGRFEHRDRINFGADAGDRGWRGRAIPLVELEPGETCGEPDCAQCSAQCPGAGV